MENNTDEDFKYAIGWNKFNLSLTSSWPTEDEGFVKRNVIPLSIGSLITFTILLPQLAVSYVYCDNLDVMVHLLFTSTSIFLSVIKLLNLRSSRDVIASIIEVMINDYRNSESEEMTDSMLKTGEPARKISVMTTILACGTVITHANAQLILGDAILPIDELDPRIQNLYLLSYLPIDFKGQFSYWAAWILQFSTTIVAAITYGSFESLLVMFIFHLCGQLKMIHSSLKRCVSEKHKDCCHLFRKELSRIVEKHIQIIEVTKRIENNFNGVIMMQLGASTLTFCLQAYAMIEFFFFRQGQLSFIDIYQMIFGITYMIYTIMLLFIFCWSANNLIVESEKFAGAWYEGLWYNLPPDQQRSLLLLRFGSMKPLHITAGKFTAISLDLFVEVMKTSGGYLSMLLAVRSQEERELLT